MCCLLRPEFEPQGWWRTKRYPTLIMRRHNTSLHASYVEMHLSTIPFCSTHIFSCKLTTVHFRPNIKYAVTSRPISKWDSLHNKIVFTDTVHVRLWPLSSQLVHAFPIMNHWSKWSQYKAYGISLFRACVEAKAWISIQWLLMCTCWGIWSLGSHFY